MLRGAGTRFVARLAIGAAAGFKHIAWPRIQSAAQGRRGATAALVAVSASVLLGMAALAMEGGDIYLNRLNAQTSADAAAMAAASAYQYRGRSAALAAAVEVAGRNGFTAAMVTVNNPPTSGSATGNTNAFEVLINKPVPVSLSTAFLGAASVMASRRSVAGLQLNSRACILATSGSVTVQNSSSFNAANCYVGSNLPGVGVNIPQSNNQVVAQGITAVGTCSGCNNVRWSFAQGYQEHSPPMSNPYAFLDSKAHPTISGASCLNTTPLNARGPILPSGTSKAYCASVTVSNTSAVTFSPGTYVFQNASLTIGSIASFACAGCSFIFLGSNPGTLSISNTSTVTISAPTTNSSDSDYDGVLFHRLGPSATGSSGAPTLNLQSVSSFNLSGGIYFPNAYIKIGNVSSNANTGCLALVGGTIEIGSLSSYRFDVSTCASQGTRVPGTQTARLME